MVVRNALDLPPVVGVEEGGGFGPALRIYGFERTTHSWVGDEVQISPT